MKKYIVFIYNQITSEFEYKSNITKITSEGGLYRVIFQNGASYNYSRDKLLFYNFVSRQENVRIYFKGQFCASYHTVDDYEDYIICQGDKFQSLPIRKCSDLEIVPVKLDTQQSQSALEYFKAISAQSQHASFTMPSEMEESPIVNDLVSTALDAIDLRETRSVLSSYLDGKLPKSSSFNKTIIYPFGCNESQKDAVEMALANSMSIIEGPPGTGKTQTILNLIANLILQGKTIAVVSNNNSAVFNIWEKLVKNNYGFLVASLGSNENKTKFFQELKPQELGEEFCITREQNVEAELEVKRIGNLLDECFERRNRLAILQVNLADAEVEYKHLQADYCFAEEQKTMFDRKFHCRWNKEKALKLRGILSKGKLSFWDKVSLTFGYRYFKLSDFKQDYELLVRYADHKFYEQYIESLHTEITQCESWLETHKEQELLNRFIEFSKILFHASLYDKYKNLQPFHFDIHSYKNNYDELVKRYPIVTSSTSALHTSVPRDYLFDYLIIDEASQVDIIKSSICFSCTRNVVVVGDSMQLSHIVEDEQGQVAQSLLEKYKVGEAYNYVDKSILNSLKTLYGDKIKSTLLKEHYRCHPAIIGYCNKKYYNNELVVMSKNTNHPFRIIETNITGTYNNASQRQVDETLHYIMNKYSDQLSSVGVVSPYRNHAELLKSQLPKEVLADTIHKFQGSEKNVIIYNTVRGDINSFSDNANLINVAVSRAKDELVIIKPASMELPLGSNIGDLIRYILYTTEPQNTMVKGAVSSVFDLLYKEYNATFSAFIETNKQISGSAAEVIMHKLLLEILGQSRYSSIDFVREYRLRDLVRDDSLFTDEELQFIKRRSRLDFLLYSKIDKSPIFALEVDGKSFHSNEIQQERDRIKDQVLAKLNLPILRLSTDGHGEKETITQTLDSVMGSYRV